MNLPVSAPCVIHLNGPINAGKSTIGPRVAALLPQGVWIDGDDLAGPDDLPREAQWEQAHARLAEAIAALRVGTLVLGYPMDQALYERLHAAAQEAGARLLVVTLSPPLDVALSDRGERRLTPEERARVAEMYEQGYPSRPFSDLVLNTARLSPDECAEDIVALAATAGR
ncbi:shikimate kinase [Bordetella genomosp. 1]|uniref:Shikimate kinase n=1 Tax=Bordetella genomosp. 1 TaxID=1395607 RepID=A0A261S7P8_9BORD|nr:hypothetical protein [Bordetella genomosp. 1]MDQ8034219.1 shikimate kinase [Bordetella sp.]OZI32982.1 shikimate kinase [Bordetella genomosp. 1]OZI57086.1 hypothetical protein CAL27_22810 [Bordetella genomosp. 1]